jgi:hypothetical protein
MDTQLEKQHKHTLQELTDQLAEEQAKQGFFPEKEFEKLMSTPVNPNERFENNKYFQPTKIVVKMSAPELGLGVFATQDINPGEIVERCPMIQMAWRSRYLGDPVVTKYMYSDQGCSCSQCQMHGHHMYMVLGYGMIYNHQNEPNTEWHFNYKNLLADVVAIKQINAGEEIFVSYGSNYFKNREYFDASIKE